MPGPYSSRNQSRTAFALKPQRDAQYDTGYCCSSMSGTSSCSIPAKSMPQIERQARTRAENKLAKPPGFAHTTAVPSDAHVRVRLFKMRPPFREIPIDAGRAAAEMPEMLQGGPQAPGRGRRRRNIQGERVLRQRLRKEGAEERGRRVQGGPRSQAGRRVKARGESWGRHPRGGAGLGRPIQKMRVLS